jgi:hypothetical protein
MRWARGARRAYTMADRNNPMRGRASESTLRLFVSVKWLQGYLNEYPWRYNRRDNEWAFLDLIAAAASRAR